MNISKISVDELSNLFNFPEKAPLSEAIILSALSINKKNQFLKIKNYRESAFSELWRKQFHHGDNWTPQYRTELNQGIGRLAFRVFESPENQGYEYRLKNKDINNDDKKIIMRLKEVIKKIESGTELVENDNEELFQNKLSWISPKKTVGKINKKKARKINKINSKKFDRDPRISKAALLDSNYQCQINPNHKTFIHPKTKMNFVEAHHLIPMEFYENFEYCIDVEENIIALCPNCHEEIHKSDILNKKKLLNKLFNKKKEEELQKKGIKISLKELIKYYE